MSIKVDVTGIKETVKRIEKLGEAVAEEADKEMGYSIRDIERDAKRNAPVGVSGDLRSRVDYNNTFLNKEVKFLAPYAPYIEFGTKSKVDVPPDLKKYAMQFKGGDGSTESLEKIKEGIYHWAKLKGIPEDMWSIVYFTIMKNGIKAQPFLFPAARKEYPKLKRKLEKIVNKKR